MIRTSKEPYRSPLPCLARCFVKHRHISDTLCVYDVHDFTVCAPLDVSGKTDVSFRSWYLQGVTHSEGRTDQSGARISISNKMFREIYIDRSLVCFMYDTICTSYTIIRFVKDRQIPDVWVYTICTSYHTPLDVSGKTYADPWHMCT